MFDGESRCYDAIVKRLVKYDGDLQGATVDRGILGYGAKGYTYIGKPLHLS